MQLQRQIKDIAQLPLFCSAANCWFPAGRRKTTSSIWFRNFKAFGKVEITRIASVEACMTTCGA
jgi:hypothetical protein